MRSPGFEFYDRAEVCLRCCACAWICAWVCACVPSLDALRTSSRAKAIARGLGWEGITAWRSQATVTATALHPRSEIYRGRVDSKSYKADGEDFYTSA